MPSVILRPSGVGSETSLTGSWPVMGSHWDKVCEEEADGDDTQVFNDYPGWKRDLYALPSPPGGLGAINFIKVYVVCRKDSVDHGGWVKISILSDSTVTDDTFQVLSTDYETFTKQWNSNPADGAWEWSDIEDLEIGINLLTQTAGFEARCTQVYVKIDYAPAIVGPFPTHFRV